MKIAHETVNTLRQKSLRIAHEYLSRTGRQGNPTRLDRLSEVAYDTLSHGGTKKAALNAIRTAETREGALVGF